MVRVGPSRYPPDCQGPSLRHGNDRVRNWRYFPSLLLLWAELGGCGLMDASHGVSSVSVCV